MGPSSGTWAPPLLQEGTNRQQVASSCKAVPKPGIPPDVRIQRVVRAREAGKKLAKAIRDEYRQKKGTGRARVVERLRGQWEHDMQQRVADLSLQLRRAMVAVGAGHRLAVDHMDELERAASASRQLQERRRLEEARRAVTAHRVQKSQYQNQVERPRALSLQRNQTRQVRSHRDREVAHQKAAEQARLDALTAEARRAAEAKSRDPAITVVRHQERTIEQAGAALHDFSKTRYHAKVVRHGTNGGGVHDDVTRLREDLEGHRAAREAREEEQKRQAEMRQKHAAQREHSGRVLRNVEDDLESLAVLDRRRKQHKGIIVQRGAIVPQSAGRRARHEERQRCAAMEEVLLASMELNGPEPRSGSMGPPSVGQSRPAVCLHPGRPPPPPLTDLEWMRPPKAPVVHSVEVEDDQSQVELQETEGDGNKLTPYQGVDEIRARISALRQQLDVELARNWRSVDSPSTLGSSPAAPPDASKGSSPAHAGPESSGAGIGVPAAHLRPYAEGEEEEQVSVEADEEPRADIPRPTREAVSSHSELALPATAPSAEGHVEADRYELPSEAITEERPRSEHPEQEQSEAFMIQPEAPVSLADAEGPVAAVDISTDLMPQRRSSSTELRATVRAQEASTGPTDLSDEPTSAVYTGRVEGAEGGADGGHGEPMIVKGEAMSQHSRLTPPDHGDQAEQSGFVITHGEGVVEQSRRHTDEESEQPLLRAMEELANHLRDRRLCFDPKVDALMEQQRKLREAMEVTRQLEQDQLRRQASAPLELNTGVLPPASAAAATGGGADVTSRAVPTPREWTGPRQGSTAMGGGVGGSDELSSLGEASGANSDLTSDHDSQLGQSLRAPEAQGGQVALSSQDQSPSAEQDSLSDSLSSWLDGGGASQFLGSEGLHSEGQIVEMSLSEGDLEIASYPSSWRQLGAGAGEEVLLHDLNVQVESELLMLIEQELDTDGDRRQQLVDVGSVHRSASASSRTEPAESI